MPGTGTYVQNTEDHVKPMADGFLYDKEAQQAVNVLMDRVNQTKNLADETLQKFDTVTTALNSMITSVVKPEEALALIGSVAISNVDEFPARTTQEKPVKPDLPAFADDIWPIAPMFKAVPTFDYGFTDPSKPTTVNPSLGYTMTTYSSEMWLALFQKVYDAINNPGSGIDADIEADLYERDRLRRQDEIDETYLAASQELGRRGLRFPQLAIRSLEQKVGKTILKTQTESSHTIRIDQSKLAIQLREANLDRGVTLEQAIRNMWEVRERLNLDAATAAANLVLTNYSEGIKGYLAEWQGKSDKIKTLAEVVKAISGENQALSDVFKAQADVAIARVEKTSKERQSLMDGYKVDGDVYEASTRADANWYNALTENVKSETDRLRLKIEQVSAQAKALIDTDLSYNQLKAKLLEALGGFFSQLVASSWAAVHTSVGHSTSRGETRAEHWGHNDSISDSHNTEHDPEA